MNYLIIGASSGIGSEISKKLNEQGHHVFTAQRNAVNSVGNHQQFNAVENELDVLLCWMGNKPLKAGNKYLLQINSRVVKAVVKEIEYKLDVNSLLQEPSPDQAQLNDIVKVKIKTASPIPYDSYKKLRVNGGAILIDETSNVTVGACMIQ
jgi:sulfate adenylyltransferase subunit 1